MAQAYNLFPGTTEVDDSRPLLQERDEALRSNFSHTAFPTSPAAVVGQHCYRIDLGREFVLVSTGPEVWVECVQNRQGANIASAATINLDNAGGDYAHITGTTTITGCTLAQGKERTVVFDASLLLTNGASLILPGNANLQTAAGDAMVVRGEAAGVVRVLHYQRFAADEARIGVEGAAIASAATVNLDAATGDFLHITGTTNISAVTLGQGKKRIVVFDGILSLVNSGSLILPGAANLNTAAGDIACFVGEGSAVTRLLWITRANASDGRLHVKSDNVASAATVNLDAASGDLVHITGTTGISTITLGAGKERTVIFDAVLLLTHGANLLLPGAANITTAAGDVAVFRGDGASVTKCVCYTRANGLPVEPDLAAIGALGGTGILVRTGSNAWAQRTLQSGDGISIGNGSGAGGDPSIAVTADVLRDADIGGVVQAASAKLSALAASSGVSGTITVSTSGPSGGADGDIWLQREA
jgi:hypothetical protein